MLFNMKQDMKVMIMKTCAIKMFRKLANPILDIASTIQTNMDKRLFSCGVFIDLKKAFDTVDHNILLHKLDYCGFRGVINIWFSSYLQGRIQTTQIDSYISARKDTTCGVPQGSVLGPLLFKILLKSATSSCLLTTRIPYMLTKTLGDWN